MEDFEDCGHLLILANSAELVMEAEARKYDGGNEVSAGVSRMRREKSGSHCNGKTKRSSQVRRQARSGSNRVVVLDQGRRLRLTQVKRLARSRSHFELQQNGSSANGLARVSRPSELLGLEARTGSDCLVRQVVEEVADEELDRKRRIEATIAKIFGEGEGFP